MYTYTVSDIANILGMTPGALHYFERENLIDIEKDVRGHRVYSVADVFRLISYVKYRSMGLSMKTITRQFNGDENNLQLIFLRLQKCKEEAVKKADHYNCLVNAIDQHIYSAAKIDDLLDKYEFAQSPAVKFCYDDECGWISRDRRTQAQVRKFIKAQPMVRLGIILHMPEPSAKRASAGVTSTAFNSSFGYTVVPEQHEKLALPKTMHLKDFPPMSCLHTIVTIGNQFIENPQIVFEKPLQYANSRGFEITGSPWGHILLGEVAPKVKILAYFELWIPIC